MLQWQPHDLLAGEKLIPSLPNKLPVANLESEMVSSVLPFWKERNCCSLSNWEKFNQRLLSLVVFKISHLRAHYHTYTHTQAQAEFVCVTTEWVLWFYEMSLYISYQQSIHGKLKCLHVVNITYFWKHRKEKGNYCDLWHDMIKILRFLSSFWPIFD